jgi:nicotinamide mononucleotide transporter
MNPLEIAAMLAVVICVLLAVKRSLWQFPFGFLGTLLYLIVFWEARLYSSAVLQVFFMAVQGYGWWYWMRGDNGQRPPIRRSPPLWLALWCVCGLAFAWLLSEALGRWTDAKMALTDAAILGLSVVAQVLLDRKRLENWLVWAVINALSVWVYASQGLHVTAALYVFLFFNAFWGHWEWLRAYRQQAATAS